MKRLYMLSVAAALFFAACEKEDMTFEQPQSPAQGGSGDYIINPEDTAGIVIPEGCGLVVFPGKMQTRAVSGESDRITTLSILLYKHDGTDFKYYKTEKIDAPKSWPLKAATNITEIGKYRAVFVGNMDATLFGNEEVLTNVGEGYSYSDARINLPSISLFNEKNLFHWCSSQEFELTKENPVATVPILLQRIVTRSSLTTYGIPENITVTGKDYPSRFYASLLEPEHELGLYKQVFGKPFENCLREMLIRDIVFPLAYVYSQGNRTLDESMEVGKWYKGISANMDEYLKTYLLKNEWGYAKDGYQSVDEVKEGLEQLIKNFSGSTDFIDKIPDYINGIYTGETDLSGFAAQIIQDDIQNLDDYSDGGVHKSFTKAKEEIINALKESQQGNVDAIFPVWSSASNAAVEFSGNYPSAIDFDLNVMENASVPSSVIGLTTPQNPNGNEDKSLNIYLLGENKEETSYQFGLTSFNVSEKNYPVEGISGQSLQPNTWMNYRLVTENITLGEVYSSNSPCKIIVDYKYWYEKVNKESNGSAFVQKPLRFSHKVINVDLNKWFVGNGRLDNNSDQAHMFFKIPDFSSENLKGDLKWKAETK